MIYLLVGIASLGGVLFGYETGVAAGALHLASNAWALDGHYLGAAQHRHLDRRSWWARY